jgi:uncharacterized membrane protein YbhN (UPF0104 family)
MKRNVRLGIAIGLIVLTISVFVYYLTHHRSLITQLRHTPPSVVITLLLLYIFWFVALAGIMHASLRICKRSLGFKENFLLNAYSSLVNFFVPGQGGIAVRGYYLKKQRDLKVRNYIFTTLLYYMCYALTSTLLLLADNRPWWQTLFALIVVSAGSISILWLYRKRSRIIGDELNLSATNIAYLFIATLFQAGMQISIYMEELHRVDTHIALSQAITYTGAANFALFVALTPGAIGIRESFLIFSRRLHHISAANIVAANLIDRAVFIAFLGILFIVTLGFHTTYRSSLRAAEKEAIDAKVA